LQGGLKGCLQVLFAVGGDYLLSMAKRPGLHPFSSCLSLCAITMACSVDVGGKAHV
jgi:hypothetical protein